MGLLNLDPSLRRWALCGKFRERPTADDPPTSDLNASSLLLLADAEQDQLTLKLTELRNTG